MRCIILEDEELARVEMRQLLSVYPDVNIVGEAGDVDTALEMSARLKPDVIFLDITLRGETGFDFVARAPEPLPHLVFVTGYDSYAIRGFECNALDYLLKPVRSERLAATLDRIRQRTPLPVPVITADDTIFLKIGSTAKMVAWSDIRYVVSSGNYTRVNFVKGSSSIILKPLKEWLDVAPKGVFLQVHRTTLVNQRHVQEVRSSSEGRRELLMSDGSLLAVGRSFWPSLKTALSL